MPMVLALQSLLPNAATVTTLLCWHQQALSWTHGSISTSTVLAAVKRARDQQGKLDLTRLQLQDIGILLACLAGTITNAAELSSDDCWAAESARHGHLWYMAAVACMRASRPDLRHLRIIQTLFLSSEALGLRKEQLAMLDAVPGLVGADYFEHFYEDTIDRLTSGPWPQAAHRPVQEDHQRRMWMQLCVQSWLATRALAPELNDHDDLSAGSETDREAQRSVLASVAYVSPSFKEKMHDEIVQISQQRVTCTTNFHALVRSDTQLRALTTEPAYLTSHANQVAHSHIILLLHHRYFVESLTDPQFAFSHWASVEASKHIVASIEDGSRKGVIAIWTFLCPLVTAAIALSNALSCMRSSPLELTTLTVALDKAIILIRSSCYSEMLR